MHDLRIKKEALEAAARENLAALKEGMPLLNVDDIFDIQEVGGELALISGIIDHKEVGNFLLEQVPVELQPQLAAAAGYAAGMTAKGRGWRKIIPRKPMVPGTGNFIIDRKKSLILMEKRWNSDGNWGMPGGGLRFDETLEECALREGTEETGYMLRLVRLLGIYSGNTLLVYSDGEQRKCVAALYELEVIGGKLKVSTESLELKWMSFDDALALPMLPVHREILEMGLALL